MKIKKTARAKLHLPTHPHLNMISLISRSRSVAGLFFLSACACHATIYVSPQGSDDNQGTQENPVASVQRALTLSIQKKDPNILLADGLYFASNPITITSKHSGTAQHPRTIKAAHEGKAILSAGQSLEVTWTAYKDGIYQTKIPSHIDLSTGFDGLFIDGFTPRMARFPNYDRNARWLKGSSAEAFSAKRIQSWQDPTGGFLHAMHPSHWGGNHWMITGKKSDTQCSLKGGWMNNRGGGIHPKDRYVENIFEELDTANEWYLNRKTRTLYFKPTDKVFPKKSTIIFSKFESCVRIEGSEPSPVKHITFDGVSFRHTTRTFMKTKEPLLRSDWKIYRQGAFFLHGAENITVKNAEFTQLGGNAYFASGYNRNLVVKGAHFFQIGAGAIQFVGDTQAVYNPDYLPYGKATSWKDLNKKDRGPRTNAYPAQCVAEDCLIHDIGLIEKQVAGLQISVAYQITGSHLSIYDVPRSGINISENAFGGHLIQGCDVFDTVQESSDHGSFNSWGRDRYWSPRRKEVYKRVSAIPELPKLDMLARNVIRNSRWRCDYGWDIDLDDGSSWYLIENNLCLGGGIKLREGYFREVRNNLVVANGFHPHVWYKNSGDVIKHNIWATSIAAISLEGKGKFWDKNIYLTPEALKKAQAYGVDLHGVFAPIQFTNPKKLDYTFTPSPTVSRAGFKPFDLSHFGVQKPSLKKLARTPTPPTLAKSEEAINTEIYPVLGAQFKNLTTLGDISATGLPDKWGARLLEVKQGGWADKAGFQTNDVVRSLNGKPITSCLDFFYAWAHADAASPIKATIWRNQWKRTLSLPPFPGVSLPAANAVIHGGPVYDAKKNFIGRWTNPKATLQWQVHLKPKTKYRVLINQASPAKHSNTWTLTGLASPLVGHTVQTKGWESFQTILLKSVAYSADNQNVESDQKTTLTLTPKSTKGALINLREILLIEE